MLMKKSPILIIALLALASCSNLPANITTFSVDWLNYDGTVLETDANIPYGSMPHYDGEIPTRESDDVFDYVFSSWDKELTPVTENTSYTAVFDYVPRKGEVVASKPSGFYDEPFLLTLSAPKGFDIYYTLDNSDPNEYSTKYSEPILIKDASSNPNNYSVRDGISSLDVYYPSELVDKCTIVKAIAINKMSGERTNFFYFNYFVGFQSKTGYENMPIVTLNVRDEYLYDYDSGIYVTGRIYDESEHTGYPETYPANYHQKGKEWERPANFKYFDGNKILQSEQNIGIRIHGGWSRAFNQKSFNLYARKDYSGTSTFNYKFFDDINAHSLMLRSGGYRDTDLTKIRDSLNQDFSVNESFDVQRSFPTIVFLNGEYWGIYNLQERFSDHYVEEHHGVDNKKILIIRNDEIDEGQQTDFHFYEELVSFFQTNDFSNPGKYEEAKSFIDMSEFAQYMSTQLYVGNIDWPGNNVRVYKDVSDLNSKWHFMMYDTDDSSAIHSKCLVNVDPFLTSAHWKSGPLEDTCLLGLMLSKLIQNATFKALFRETFIRIGQNKFSPTNVNNYLDNKIALLSEPMVKNYKRFVNNTYDSTYFVSKVNIIKNFFQDRYSYALGFLNSHIPE